MTTSMKAVLRRQEVTMRCQSETERARDAPSRWRGGSLGSELSAGEVRWGLSVSKEVKIRYYGRTASAAQKPTSKSMVLNALSFCMV